MKFCLAALTLTGLPLASASCNCKDVSSSYLVTRLWDIDDANQTPQGVIEAFESGFADDVQALSGFQEYVGASTGNPRTVFFMNIFETEERATAATTAAAAFVDDGDLSGQISENTFTQNSMYFHISSDTCITESIEGKYLSTRLWKLGNETTLTQEEVADIFRDGYGPVVSAEPGFLEYGGAIVAGTDQIFFYNVFDSQAEAEAANQGAANFVANGDLAGQIESVVFTQGQISFDFTCVEDAAVDDPDTTTCDSKEVDSSYVVTRLWNIIGEMSADEIISTFEDGFADQVSALPGFQEYVAATTGEDNTVFFMNIFKNEETASVAQAAAAAFAEDEGLGSEVEENTFTEARMSFHLASSDTITESIAGKYLSTRLWAMKATASLTQQDVADEFETGYGPIVSAEDGFLEYGGAVVPGTSYVFFYNVFETEAQAMAANEGATTFVSDNNLNDEIEMVVFTEGLIVFDFTCVEEDIGAGSGDGDGSGDGNGDSGVMSSFGATSAFMAMVFSFFFC